MGVNDRVSDHRRRMRDQGYRLIQTWVPDVRSESFAAEAHRQSTAVAEVDRQTDDQSFIEAASTGWDE